MRIAVNTILSFLMIFNFFVMPDLAANQQNFYQQHLRISRNALDQNDVRASKAMGKLAARISGQPAPSNTTPAAAATITSDTDIIELLKIAPGQQGLGIAQSLKSRLSQPNLLLEEYIARCYWAIGENTRAAELSNTLLLEYESPSLRRFLANDAQKKGAHDLAKHHLAKSDVTKAKWLLARLEIWFSEVSLFQVLFAAILMFIVLYKKTLIKAIHTVFPTMTAAKTAKDSTIIVNKAAKSGKSENPAKSNKSSAKKQKNKNKKTSFTNGLIPVREENSESAFAESARMVANANESQGSSNEFAYKSTATTIDEAQNNDIEVPNDLDQAMKNPVLLSAQFCDHVEAVPELYAPRFDHSEIIVNPSARFADLVIADPEPAENFSEFNRLTPEPIENPLDSDYSIPDELSRLSPELSSKPSAKSIHDSSDLPDGFRQDVLEQHFDNQLGFMEPKSARLFFLGLQLALSEKMMRTLVITSATENANRALAGFQLAKMFADDDYQTLLIDANDFGQFLHEIYCCEPAPGLADLINPDNSFATVFKNTEQTQLTLLTCGSEATGFSDLSNQALELLLSYCRKNFEIIILILPAAAKLQEKLSIIKDFGVVFLESHPSSEEGKSLGLPLAGNSLSVLGRILSNQE